MSVTLSSGLDMVGSPRVRSKSITETWFCKRCNHENKPLKFVYFEISRFSCERCSYVSAIPPTYAFTFTSISINNLPILPDIHDQGEEGTCVFHALLGAVEFLWKRDSAYQKVKFSNTLCIKDFIQKYNQMSVLPFDSPEEIRRGARIVGGLNVLKEMGVKDEEDSGRVYKIFGWSSAKAQDVSFYQVSQILANGTPVIASVFGEQKIKRVNRRKVYSSSSIKPSTQKKLHTVVLIGATQDGGEIVTYMDSHGPNLFENGTAHIFYEECQFELYIITI